MITPVSCTGKNPLGTIDVQEQSEGQSSDGDQQRRGLVAEDELQRPP